EKLAIVQDYAKNFLSMTNDKADQLAQRIMVLDDQRMALRKKYYELMKKAIPTVLVVRFFQVENQIQLLVDLQIASNLPIIEEANKSQGRLPRRPPAAPKPFQRSLTNCKSLFRNLLAVSPLKQKKKLARSRVPLRVIRFPRHPFSTQTPAIRTFQTHTEGTHLSYGSLGVH